MTIYILLVEDKPEHLGDARAYFAEVEAKSDVKVDYATNLAEARDMIAQRDYQGVISDIFFHLGNVEDPEAELQGLESALRTPRFENRMNEWRFREEKKYEGIKDSMTKWKNGDTLPPAGVAIAEEVIYLELPFVFNTDTFHHGDASEPIHQYNDYNKRMTQSGEESFRIPYVETGDRETQTSGSKKNFDLAYRKLVLDLEKGAINKEFRFRERRNLNELIEGKTEEINPTPEMMALHNSINQKYGLI
jgi:hypothetical protein